MTAELAVRATALLAVGTVACWAMRPMAAAARHAVWRLTIVATLALPLAGLLCPSWFLLAEPQPMAPDSTPHDVVSAGRLGEHPFLGSSFTATPVAELAAGASARAPRIWAAGALALAAYFLAGYLRLWIVRRRARPAPYAWMGGAARAAIRVRLRRETEVLVTADVPGPLVTGLLRPAVLIPPDACGWNQARREAVLIHELAHVSRRDIATQLAAHALVSLHWFNPLAWRALRQVRRERELACDDEVLRAGIAPLAYATELLAIAVASPVRSVSAAALSMARPSDLEARLVALLDGIPRRHGRLAPFCLSIVLAAACATVAGAHLTPPSSMQPGGESSWSRNTVRMTLLPGGDEAPSPAPDAATLLSAADVATRERAAAALALSSGADAIPPLLRALADSDARVRERAAIGLAWRRDARIGPALIAAAADPDPDVREKALLALAFSGEPRASAVIEAAGEDPDPGVRSTATTLGGVR